MNLWGIKSDIENMECEILGSKCNLNFLKHNDNYVYCNKYCKKILVHSNDFQNCAPKKIKLINSFEKPDLISPRNIYSKYSKTLILLESAAHSTKLDRINMIKYYTKSIVSNENRKSCNFLKQYVENNLSPPFEYFVDICDLHKAIRHPNVTSTDSISNDIEGLPSLPIINHTENRLEERKLSILQPLPPGLVSRRKSNKNWNCLIF